MRGRYKSRPLVVVAVVITASAVALILLARQRATKTSAPHQSTLAQLVAKNYRRLTVRQSRRLVLYARAEYQCLIQQGLQVAKPIPSPTRITMRVPHETARKIVRFQMQCDDEVGAPPEDATLQARREQVLVYLPKWCLLHPTELQKT